MPELRPQRRTARGHQAAVSLAASPLLPDLLWVATVRSLSPTMAAVVLGEVGQPFGNGAHIRDVGR